MLKDFLGRDSRRTIQETNFHEMVYKGVRTETTMNLQCVHTHVYRDLTECTGTLHLSVRGKTRDEEQYKSGKDTNTHDYTH